MTLPILSAADDGFCNKQARASRDALPSPSPRPRAICSDLPSSSPSYRVAPIILRYQRTAHTEVAQRSFLASTTAAVEDGLIHHVVAFRRSSCLGRLRMRTLYIRSNRFEVPHS